MGAAKEIFLKDKTLVEKWAAWTHQQDCARVIAFADAEFINCDALSPDMIRGMKLFKAILLNLADTDEPEAEIPGSGLVHDIDPKPRLLKPTPKK